MARRALSWLEKFWSMVDVRGPDECWPWTGFLDKDGYGWIKSGDRRIGAHRVGYCVTRGPRGIDPETLTPEDKICHTCDNPTCCNPAHLWKGTSLDNTTDMIRKGRKASITGANHANAKLTDEDVDKIRTMYAKGGYTQREIANMFGVGTWTVSMIATNKYRSKGGEVKSFKYRRGNATARKE